MKNLSLGLVLLCGFFIYVVSPAGATPYVFTIDDNTLASANFYAGDLSTQDPYPIGTRKMTVHEWISGSDQVTGEYYSETGDSDFLNEYWNEDWWLVEFNLWGFGGDDAERWGETETYTPTNPITVPSKWAYNYMTIMGHSVLHFYLTSNYFWDGGIKIREGVTPDVEFKFVADVSDPDLTIWFGGTLNNCQTVAGSTHKWIKYQGNIQLRGTPVPEPSTIILLGFALLGLGTMAFGKGLTRRDN